ncbi:MAG: GAF domain-containing protein [Prochloraceae cyanobacterium]
MEVQAILPEDNSEFSQESIDNSGEKKINGNGFGSQLNTAQKEKIDKFKKKLFQRERDRLGKISAKIRKSTDLDSFLLNTTAVIRSELQVDRVGIYRFEGESNGQIVAESLVEGWTPTIDEIVPCIAFGAHKASEYQSKEFVSIEDSEQEKLSPHQKQLLEKFQVRASLAIPILLNSSFASETNAYTLDKVWGLLVIQQCDRSRQWQEEEINLLYQVATELTLALQPTQPYLQVGQQKDIFTSINQQMQEWMQNWLDQLRQSLKADRVLVYGFNPDWSGEVLAESVDSNWEKAGSSFDKDYSLKGEEYKQYYVVNDIYTKDYPRCLIEQLEKLQARAYIAVPIQQNNQLQGVLTVYQNSGPRNWQKSELNLMLKFAPKFSLPLQQTEYFRRTQFQTQQMEQAFQRERGLAKMLERMRTAKDEQTVFQIATQDGRKLLAAERLAVYRFNPDWSGEFIAESVAPGWSSLIENIPIVQDTFLQQTQGGRYVHGECFAVDDIYTIGHQACHIQLLEQFEARAYAIAPIFVANKKLWGFVAVYQNSGVRKWQAEEVEALRQIGLQVGIAMEQINYIGKLQAKAEQEKATDKIIERIRKSLDLKEIFQVATREVRELLEADRVIVYRFNSDWSGEILAESVGSEWVSAMELQKTDDSVYNSDMSANERCTLTSLQASSALDNDTYFRETKGGDYRKGKKFQLVNDVYAAGFSPCYLESLEKYQARAYIIVPIFQNNQLQGLFAAYQNSGPRNWQKSEVYLMLKIAPQLSFALEQASYVRQIQAQSEQLQKNLKRQQGLARMLERMQQAQTQETAFQIATQETRKLLEADRVVIYHFNPDWSGEFVGESATSGWSSLMKSMPAVKDSYLQETGGGRFSNKQSLVVNDIYRAGYEACHVELLEEMEAKAYTIAPIFMAEKLWGLVAAYQNTGPRIWEEEDVNVLQQVGVQVGTALQQINYLEQLRLQSENLAQTLEREKTAKEQLQQQAVQMLATVRPAFKGDLTVRADVTEDQIGTIAAAYNTTLDSLREIVIQVKTAVEQVAQTTTNSNTAITGLSSKAQGQFQELNLALEQIEQMANATEVTTKNAHKVETAIVQANQTVQVGDKAMNKTVESILEIRQTVAEAGKRVKRLRESSQKISKVVSLIGSFATQTNLLALNAALEATRAGEYGKGFAVVADEVRNLSLQSAEATTEIEKLVQNIQEETQEVSAAMERGVEQVAEGTSLVNETRESLNAIVASTEEISQLVERISSAANSQTKQADAVTEKMKQVATIANDTSSDSLKISASFQQLLTMAQELQASVAKFKVN